MKISISISFLHLLDAGYLDEDNENRIKNSAFLNMKGKKTAYWFLKTFCWFDLADRF